MRNAGLEETQAGIKMAGRNINNLRYAGDTALMAESEEEQKILLMKVKEEWKIWLKTQHSENEDHGIQSEHFMGNKQVTWSSPGGSRVIQSGDGIGEEKLIYLFNQKYKIRLGRNSVVGKLSGEKRLNNLVYVESQ